MYYLKLYSKYLGLSLVMFLYCQTLMAQNYALNFDGVDDYVDLGTTSRVKLTASMTLGIWVYRSDWSTPVLQTIVGNKGAGGVNGYALNISNATANGTGTYVTSQIYRNAAYSLVVSDVSTLTPGWHYLAMTYSGRFSKLFVDGVEVGTAVDGGANYGIAYGTGSSTSIGANSATGSGYFLGSIDEFRIYNTALTDAQIKAAMTDNGVGASGLFAQYKFDNAPSSSANTVISTDGVSGSLINFALTGTTSNWVESYAMAVPTFTAATNITATKFTANWTVPAVGVANNYILDVATDVAFTNAVSGSPFTLTVRTKEITGLDVGTTYYCRVRANKNTVPGQGTPSATLAIQTLKLDQTISAISDVTKTFGDAAFEPAATSSAGLAVSYVSADNSIAEAFQDAADGNKWKINIKKGGVVDITANQTGNTTYNAATPVVFKLTINKATATVTLTPSTLSATYNGTAKTVLATTNATGSSTFTYTYDGATTAPTNAGNYAVAATLVNNGFSGSASGSLVIDKATQIITFSSLAVKMIGAPDFEPGATVNTGLPISYTSSNAAVATVIQDAGDANKWKIHLVNVGETDITATQAGNANYNQASLLRVQKVNVATLPVVLTSFKVIAEGNKAKLMWTTETEKNNANFEVQRSIDGIHFIYLGSVNGNGTTVTSHSYTLYDLYPEMGTTYYRLLQYDGDGKGRVLEIKTFSNKLSTGIVAKLFPNPTNDEINLLFVGQEGKTIEVTLTDAVGKKVHVETIQVTNSNSNHILKLKAKPVPGQYLVHVTGPQLNEVIKLMVQ